MTRLLQTIEPILWRDEQLHLLDQRVLPHTEKWLTYHDSDAVAEAIKLMVVRGAPAIGVTAAYAVVLAAREAWFSAGENWKEAVEPALKRLTSSRPTAVNLSWAIERMKQACASLSKYESPEPVLLALADRIQQEDIKANRTMGQYGADLLDNDSIVLTHCNAGALATAGFGTALGVIRQGFLDGKIEHVYVDETRPWLQGSRLTAWELMQEGIPMTLQADVAAGALMASGRLDWVIVGADRIASNGDTANKIGTYSLAVLAKYHGVKVMVVAPTTTIDWLLENGSLIPIEQRMSSEVSEIGGHVIAPVEVPVSNPAFDVTPASLIDAIVTEEGVVSNPSKEKMQQLKKEGK
ncbi:methylthioribose-1-phosphate isomerase [Methylophaga marina]|uniref:Methylthioribose-1-phosphate isomerase n=1 Tax=Methylophaga marina TaxID=45495 RepID=A0ABP3CQ49_9GAMM|nr:S-methyl-5-thioribose-1-phosphate isomerase [Methylophaga marina]BDZ73267.1 methylthioribose-1-phosphate isomerase [Methylophaga marina]